jgi:hypothetical protein
MADMATLIPGNVITLYNDKVFRMSGGCVVTSLAINYNLTVEIDAAQLTYMNRWEDLDPDAVSIVEDASEDTMS